MATIKEIQKALRADPDLINRIPNLREFVNQHRKDFDFLFKDHQNKKTMNKIEEVITHETHEKIENKKWNPKIVKL